MIAGRTRRPVLRIRATQLACGVIAAAAMLAEPLCAQAQTTFTKADNTNALNLTTSWTTGTAPTSTSIGWWNGTYNTAGALSAALPGSGLTWGGIIIGNIAGTAAGTVNLGGSGNAVTNSGLTIGSSGIDMSGANQNLVINSATATFNVSQTWNVASGRNLRFGTSATGAANSRITGTNANAVITISGGGVVDLNPAASTSGLSGFAGKWQVNSGATLRTVQNFTAALGTNTSADAITLAGGTLASGGISGAQGNWSFNTPVTLAANTTSGIDMQTPTGTGRFLKLNGAFTSANGSTGLTFRDTAGAMTTESTGFIITADNPSLSGTVNFGTAGGSLFYVRVGGTAGTDNTTAVGATGSLGTAAVTINNVVLTLTRSNTWTFGNNIVSGTGVLRIGTTGVAGTTTQDVTLSGSNSWTGGVTIVNGILRVGSTNALGSTGPVTITSGTLDLNGRSQTIGLLTGAGGVITSNSAAAITLSISSASSGTFSGLISNISGTIGFTKQGAGLLRLATATNSYLGRTTAVNGTLEVVKLDVGGAVSSIGASSSDAANLFFNGGTISYVGAGDTTDRSFTMQSNAALSANGSGALTWTGTGVAFQTPDTALTLTLGGTSTSANSFGTPLADNGTGPLSLTKNGAGTWAITGPNSYSGGTTLNAGILSFGTNALGTTGAVTLNGGTLRWASGNSQDLSARLALVSSSTVTLDTNGNEVVFETGIGGSTSASVVKTGAGTLTLSASNSYTGGTTLTAGTLALGNAAALGSGTLTVNGATTLQASTPLAGASALGNNILLTSDLTIAGANGLQVSGTLSQQGADRTLTNNLPTSTTLTLGTIVLSGNDTSERRLVFAGTGNTLVSGTIASGTGAVGGVIIAGGTVTFAAANTYTGVTFIDSAVLSIADVSALGSGTGNPGRINLRNAGSTLRYTGVGSGTIANRNIFIDQPTAIGTVEVSDPAGSLTLTPSGGTRTRPFVKTGPGTLVMNGTFGGTVTANGGTLVLNGSSSSPSQTTISAGTLQVGNASALGSTAPLAVNGGTLDLAGFSTTVGILTGSGGATITSNGSGTSTLTVNSASSGTFAGAIQNGTAAVALTKLGTGTVTLSGSNSYSGGTTLSAGTLVVGDDNALGTGGLAANAGTLNLNGRTVVVPSLTGSSGASITSGVAGNAGLVVNMATTGTFGGIISNGSGTVGLTKQGTGTLILSNANTYSGATTIDAGSLQIGAGSTSGAISASSAVTINASGTLVYNRSDAVTSFASPISGAGTLRKLGAAELGLTGSNAFSGLIDIQAGKLAFENVNAAAGSPSVAIVSGATLSIGEAYVGGTATISSLSGAGVVDPMFGNTTGVRTLAVVQAASGTFSGVIRDATSGAVRTMALTKGGVGTLTLSGVNTYTGPTTIAGGTLQLQGSGTLSSSTALAVADVAGTAFDQNGISQTVAGLTGGGATGGGVLLGSGTLTVNKTSGTDTFGGAISGPGGLVKAGAGELVLTGTSSYGGATTVSSGTLRIGGGGQLGGGAYAGAISNAGVLAFESSANQTLSGTISGIGALTKAGAGTLTLAADNTYSGITTVSGGTIAVASDANLGVAPGAATAGRIILNGGALAATSGFTLDANRGIALGPTTGDGDGTIGVVTGTLAYGGVVANNGTGADGLVKSGAGSLLFTGVNTYTGSTTITAGTLEVGDAGQLGAGNYAAAVANAGTLRFSTSADQVLSGGISGGGSLVKAGSGSLTLLGNNTYAGPTTVDAGTLAVNGLVASSAITVNAGGLLAGSGSMAAVTLAGGVISPGNSPGTITVGDQFWNATSSYDWEMYDYAGSAGSPTGWDLISGTGTLSVTGTGFTFNLISMSGTDTRGLLPAGRWSQTTSGTFRIANYTSLSAPSGTWWNISTANFSPFSSTIGTFSLDVQSTFMDLVYTYTPPPAYVWTAGSGSWSGGANWDTDPNVPQGAAELVFAGSGGTATNDIASGTGAGQLSEVSSLTFSSTASGAYTLDGNAFTLGTLGIENQSAFQQTVANGITLAGASTVNAATAGLVLSGTVDNAGFLLTVTGSGPTTLGSVVTGAGGLSKLGSGTLTLWGANDYTGGTTISAGTLVVGDGGTSGVLPGDVTNDAVLVFDRSGAVTYGGEISGAGSVTKLNAGTLTLTGTSGYTGGTTISGGTLQIGSGGTAGSIVGDVTNNAALAFNRSDAVTFAGVIGGSGSLTQVGTGELTLTGVNTYAGNTTISSGTLVIGGAGQLGGGVYAGAITNDGVLAVTTSANQTLSGSVGGTGSLVKSGAGTLTLSNPANGYTGGSTITGGTVSFASGGLGPSGTVTVADAALQWATGNTDDLSSRLALVNSTTTTLDTNGNDVALATGFGGATSAALTKAGEGTLTLSGSNTYTGLTTVSGGTLQIGAGGGSGSVAGNIANAAALVFNRSDSATYAGIISGIGSLTQAGSGTLALSGVNTYTGATTITAGVLQIGVASTTGAISASSAVTIASGGTLAFNRSNNFTFANAMTGAGTVQKLAANEVDLTGSNSFSGRIDVQAGKLAFNAVNSVAGIPSVNITSGATVSLGTPYVSGTATISGLSGAGTVDTAYGGSNDTRTLHVAQATSGTFSGVLANASTSSRLLALVKSGPGTLTLSGANTYTAGTTLVSGTLVAANSSALGSGGTVTINTAATGAADTSLLIDAITGNITIARPITVANQGSGVATIGSGSLAATRQAIFSGAITLAKDVTLFGADVGDRTQFSGGIGGTGNVTVTTVGSSGRVLLLTTANTFSGNVTISPNSVLQLSDATATANSLIPDTADVTIGAGGALRIAKGNNSEAINTLLGSGTVVASTSTPTLIVGASGGSGTFSGVLANTASGTLALTKQGAGTQTLSGVSTYTGTTTVSAGTLQLFGSGSLSSSTVLSVANAAGATFDLNGRTQTVAGLTGGGATGGSVLLGSGTLEVSRASGTDTYAGLISGAGRLVKSGAGTLVLTGSNAHSGGTTLTTGILQVGNDAALGSGTAALNGGTLSSNGTAARVLANAVTVGGNVTLGDATNNGQLTLNGPVALAGGTRTLTVASAVVVTGEVSDGGLAKAGSGILTLSASNSYTGGTTLTAGTLALGNAAAMGSGTLTVNGASTLQASTPLTGASAVGNAVLLTSNLTIAGANDLQVSGTLTQQGADRTLTNNLPTSTTLTLGNIVLTGNDTTERRLTFAGTGNTLVSGTIATGTGTGAVGSIIVNGGTVTLTAANTYTGLTFVQNGVLSVANVAALGVGTGNTGRISFTGTGTLQYTGATSGTISGKQIFMDVANTTPTIDVSDAAGSLTLTPATSSAWTRPFTKLGVGSLTMNGTASGAASVTVNGGTLTLNAANTYTGTTTVNAGTLVAGNATALGSTAPLTLNGGTLDLAGFSNTVGILTGSSGATITSNGSGTSTLTVNSSSSGTFAGAIQNGTAAMALSKAGTGALVLTAANSYTGGSTLTAGSLRVGDNAALGTGTVALNGGTLSSDGATARTLANAVTVGGNMTLGDATNSGLLTFNGPVNFGGATRQITTPSNVVWSGTVTAGSGGLTKAGVGTLTLSGTSSYTGITTITAGTLALTSNNSLGSNLTNTSADTLAVLSFGANTAFIGVSGANSGQFFYGSLNGSGTMQLRGGSATIQGSNGAAGTNGNFQIFTFSGTLSPTAFALNTGVSTTDRKDFGWINDNGTVLTLSSLSGFGAIRNDAGGGGTVTRMITVDQSTDTVFNGAILSHKTASTFRQVSITKAGSGSLELAGFIGKETTAATAGSSFVYLTVTGGLLNVTNSANTTTTTTDAISSGTVTVTSGTLGFSSQALINNAGTAGFATILMNGGVLRWNAGTTQDLTAGASSRLTLVSGSTATFDTNGNDVTLANALGGSAVAAPVVKIGAGTLTLSGSNLYTGDTTISAGTLAIGGAGSLGGGSYAGAITNEAALVVATSAAQTLSGSIGGSGSLAKSGAGTLTLSAANTYAGATTISAGTLALSSAGSIQSSSGVNLSASGATLDISGADGDRTIGSLAGAANSVVVLGGNALTAGDAMNTTFGGGLSGSGGFTKAGSGILTLTAAQTLFTGDVNVSAGTLKVDGANYLQQVADRLFVADNATLDASAAGLTVFGGQTLGGYGTINTGTVGALVFNSGAFLSPGGSVGQLDGVGDATFNGGMTYVFEIDDASGTFGTSPGWDLFSTDGAVTLAASGGNPINLDILSLAGSGTGQAVNFDPNFNYAWKFVVAGSPISSFNAGWFNVDATGFSNPTSGGQFYVARGDQLGSIGGSGTDEELYVVFAAVPEPSTVVLAGIGLMVAGYAAGRRRRRRDVEDVTVGEARWLTPSDRG